MSSKLKVLHMYHDILDLYGDRGNMMTLRYRCRKRGIEFEWDTCTVGEEKNLREYNLIFMGGGADREQRIVAKDLARRKEAFEEAVSKGIQHLLICGAYQLFGDYYLDAEGQYVEGLGIGTFHTISSGSKRCIGDILVEAILDGETVPIVGFENHSGQTIGVKTPFAKVLKGQGNLVSVDNLSDYEHIITLDDADKRAFQKNEKGYHSGFEGYMSESIIGTYMHGPLLPKNPMLADYLIRKGIGAKELAPLEDYFETKAFQAAAY